MLDLFRNRSVSNAVYGVIIVATVLVFIIQFGPQGRGQRSAPLKQTCVAQVRGYCIDPKEYNVTYRLMMPRGAQGEVLAQQARQMHLKKLAVDALIERELLNAEADRLGITTTDDELNEQFFNGFMRITLPNDDPSVLAKLPPPVMQVDFRDPKTKQFDLKRYQRRIRDYTGRSEVEFREDQQRELRASKVRDLIITPIRVSESEAFDGYVRDYTTATVQHVAVKNTFAARWLVAAKEDEVAAWGKEHQTEVDKEWEERKKDDLPKPGHVRHILAGFPKGASAEEKGAAYAKISSAYARIKSGEPFALVARDLGEDGTKVKGGDLGDKTEGFVPSFRSAADALRPGEMTEGAVVSEFGYHLIVKDDPTKLADVEAQMKRYLPRALYTAAKAPEAAKALAAKIHGMMRAGKDPSLAVADVLATLAHAPAKLEPIKILKPSKVIGDAGADATLTLADAGEDKPDAGVPEASPVLKPLTPEQDHERPEVKVSSSFNVGGEPIPELGPSVNTQIVKFSMSAKDGDTMPDALSGEEGHFVIRLKERKATSREEFDKNKETYLSQLLSGKQKEILSLYVRRLRDASKGEIKVDEKYTKEDEADAGAPSPSDDEEGL